MTHGPPPPPPPSLLAQMVSWMALTARLMLGAAGSLWAETLRFPMLVMNTITVTIWWLVLAPIIHFSLGAKHRPGFWRFNASFSIVNIHGLNLPLALLDHFWLSPARRLSIDDLHVGVWLALAYLVFYLGVVESILNFRFYVILSPRTHLAPLVYTFCLSLYAGIFFLFQ